MHRAIRGSAASNLPLELRVLKGPKAPKGLQQAPRRAYWDAGAATHRMRILNFERMALKPAAGFLSLIA